MRACDDDAFMWEIFRFCTYYISRSTLPNRLKFVWELSRMLVYAQKKFGAMGLGSAPGSRDDIRKSRKIRKKSTFRMSAKSIFFSNFFAVELSFLENYPTNPLKICVGVALEHILVAISVFRVIANSQVCQIYQNIKKKSKLSVFSLTLKILLMCVLCKRIVQDTSYLNKISYFQ